MCVHLMFFPFPIGFPKVALHTPHRYVNGLTRDFPLRETIRHRIPIEEIIARLFSLAVSFHGETDSSVNSQWSDTVTPL